MGTKSENLSERTKMRFSTRLTYFENGRSFPDFPRKNMGNLGISKRLSEVFHDQDAISKKKRRRSPKFCKTCVH